MKVVETTPEMIVIKAYPWPWWVSFGMLYATLFGVVIHAIFTGKPVLLIACAVVATALLIATALLAVDYLSLKLSKPDNFILYRNLTFLGWSEHTLALDSLVEANVFEDKSPRTMGYKAWGHWPTPTLVLITHERGEPVIHHVGGWIVGHEAVFCSHCN